MLRAQPVFSFFLIWAGQGLFMLQIRKLITTVGEYTVRLNVDEMIILKRVFKIVGGLDSNG